MPYTALPTALPGVLILEPKVFGDARGFFFESFNASDFAKCTGLDVQFVQDNHSKSAKGVLRGLHYQIQHPQGKLVQVTQGEVFGQLWVPPGFAHGFLVMSESAEFLYKTTDYWFPEFERSLLWNDSTVGVDWPILGEPLLAAKDAVGHRLNDAEVYLSA